MDRRLRNRTATTTRRPLAALAADVRASNAGARNEAYWELYAEALDEAEQLRRFRYPSLDPTDAATAVDALFERSLAAVVEAHHVRAFLRTCLRNALATLLVRRRRTLPHPDLEALGVADDGPDLVEQLERLRAFASLGARERDVLLAVALGDGRARIAERLGVSRAAVDQVVSRARARVR